MRPSSNTASRPLTPVDSRPASFSTTRLEGVMRTHPSPRSLGGLPSVDRSPTNRDDLVPERGEHVDDFPEVGVRNAGLPERGREVSDEGVEVCIGYTQSLMGRSDRAP